VIPIAELIECMVDRLRELRLPPFAVRRDAMGRIRDNDAGKSRHARNLRRDQQFGNWYYVTLIPR